MYGRGSCSNVPGHNVALHWPYVNTTYSSTPDEFLAGMTVSGSDLVIPIAALADHGLTAANADPVTGDPRKVLYAFLARGEEWLKNMTYKPSALTVTPRFTAAKLERDGKTKLKIDLKYSIYRDRPDGPVSDEPA